MSIWAQNEIGDSYDWAEFTLSNGAANYDLKSNIAALFSNIPVAGIIVIETNRNITGKLNSTSYAAIKLDAGSSPIELVRKILVRDIYLSNASGSDATVRVWLFV